MTYGTHMAFGALCGAATAVAAHELSAVTGKPMPPAAAVLLVLFAVWGSLFPDIDHEESYIGRRLRVISWFASRLGHRGPLTHSLMALLGFAALVSILTLLVNQGLAVTAEALAQLLPSLRLRLAVPAAVPVGLTIGYASHLIADSGNPHGVPWLYPLTTKRYRLPVTVSTASTGEYAVAACILMLCGAVGYAGYLSYIS